MGVVVPVGGIDGGGDGHGAAGFYVSGAAGVPELGEDVAAFGADGGDDFFPGFDLLVGVEAGCSEPAACGGGDGGGFGDDEAAVGGALAVVFGHESVGDVAGLGGAGARERRHDDAMFERERTDLDGSEESFLGLSCHGDLL